MACLCTPGREGGHLAGSTPRLWLLWTPGRWYTPAVAAQRTLGMEGGHLLGSTPRLWPLRARRGGREDTG